MRKIHIIGIKDPLMFNLAIALKKENIEVSGSDPLLTERNMAVLLKHEIRVERKWNPEVLDYGLDFVAYAPSVTEENEEMVRAKEMKLVLLAAPEFIYHCTMHKTRLVIAGSKGKTTLLKIIMQVLRKRKIPFDYILPGRSSKSEQTVGFNNDARIAIIEGNEKLKLSAYRPHLALITNVTNIDYLPNYMEFVENIEREGKLIFNEKDKTLVQLSEKVRSDITAMPYGDFETIEEDGRTFLVTRFGNYPVNFPDDWSPENLNAARYACRQLGIQEKDFYSSIAENN